MAESHSTDGDRKARRRRRKSHLVHDYDRGEKTDPLGGNGERDGDLGLYDVHGIDIDRVRGSTMTRSSAANSPATSKMSLDSGTPARNVDSDSGYRRRRKHHYASAEDSKPRRKVSTSRREKSVSSSVYEVPIVRVKSKRVVTPGRKHGEARSRSPTSSDDEESSEARARSRDSRRARDSRIQEMPKREPPSRYYPPRVEYKETPSLQRSLTYTPRRPSVPDAPPAVSHQR